MDAQTSSHDAFPKELGYARYRSKDETNWTGRVRMDFLTPEKIQIWRFQGTLFEEDFSHIPDLEIPAPPKNVKVPRLKKSELECGVNYILCPDRKCGLFWDERFGRGVPCERYCPNCDKMQKIVICGSCHGPIYLPGDHFLFCTVTHEDCPSGESPTMFTRMSEKYALLYQKPK